VSANRASYPVSTMCRVLGVSLSGYYASASRPPSARAKSDAVLAERIGSIHAASHGTYGSPRVHAELRESGVHAGRKRVARLMKGAGLVGVSRRKFVTTTLADGAQPAPDLVDRTFTADGPNVLWVADITYVPTWAGFLYLAVVLDVFSRRVVGWSMSTTLHADMVLAALNMAVASRKPTGVIHHSDQGSQYTSFAFGKRCLEAGVRPSMGSVGDAYDNAMAESFFATLECELLDRRRFKTQAEARMAVFAFIEGFYNPRRRHSALDYLSPIAFERRDAETEAQMRHDGRHLPAAPSQPSCSRPSRTSPLGRAKCAPLTAAPRDGGCSRMGRGGKIRRSAGAEQKDAPGRQKGEVDAASTSTA
jgi:putative transposase